MIFELSNGEAGLLSYVFQTETESNVRMGAFFAKGVASTHGRTNERGSNKHRVREHKHERLVKGMAGCSDRCRLWHE